MKETLKISGNKDNLTIEIFPSEKPILKYIMAFQGLLLVATAVFLGYFTLTEFTDFSIITLLSLAMCFGLFILGKRYLNRIFYRETIVVTRKELTIKDKYFASVNTDTYLISEISHLGFAGQHDFTRHPLDGNTVDFTGFGVAEKEVQYLLEDGRIELFANGSTRRFGKNIASWDAEEIMDRIEKFTGNNLKIDDKMEKLLDDLSEYEDNKKTDIQNNKSEE